MSNDQYDSDMKKEISKDSSSEDSVKLEADGCSSMESSVFERKTIRYVDWRILPLLALLYSAALIDRINLGAAFVAGMNIDLKLNVGVRYNIATCIYFVPYILFQLPVNLLLLKFGVRNLLTFTVVAWGAVQLGMGFVPTWGYLTFCRILLGIFEAAFFPAMLFIISTWYKRHEVQKRIAVFYLIAVTMGGVSPILAWSLSLLDGKQGIAGWRWIFIIEGVLTLFLAIISWFFIPNFPDKNSFLTRKQTDLVLKRIEEDRGDSLPDPVTFQKVRMHLCDWTLWSYGIMFLCTVMPSYAQSYFLSIILKGMGWDRTHALLLTAPPYGPAIITTMFFAWLSDKYKHRSGFIAFQSGVCVIGLLLTAFAKQNAVRYLGIFISNAGNSGSIPGILAFGANNVVSHSKRSVQSALTISLGGIGGILASVIFRAKDAPRYLPGFAVTMGSQGVLLILLGITTTYFRRQNTLLRQGKRTKPIEGQPGFFYTL